MEEKSTLVSLAPYIELWNDTLQHIKDNETIRETSFKSWFQPLKVVNCKNNCLYLGTHEQFIIDWINDHYRELLYRNLEVVSDSKVTNFQIVLLNNDGTYISEEVDHTEEAAVATQDTKINDLTAEEEDIYTSSLNPRYTFDNFVVGDNNRFAHAAALAVAEMPGSNIYNPLLIQGGSGLGKTHLMYAIGHFIKENNHQAKVAYFTMENFVNEWISAIKDNTTQQFRNKYRKVDVILMDDIQFLANKDSCQEEFFHTYNALYDSGAQIILTTDRPPKEIAKLEDRLVTRFLWGLTTEIISPDLETRIAILQKKAAMNNIIVPQNEIDVFYYIANRYDSDIRVLEGALNRVAAYSKMEKKPITLSLTMKALENFVSENRVKVISIELIQQATAEYFKIKPDDIKGQKRTATIAYPRQIAMYLCRELTDATYEKIGEEFGKRHYSTVMHAFDEITERAATNEATAKQIKELTESIRKL